MAKTKISEFSATPGNNTDIDSINIAENCAPSGINDAIRELMAQLKDWQAGTSNDPMVIGSTGSLTLSYGTANGVPYLNGSKVLTSGSALVFDGTNFGVGISNPAQKLEVVGTQGRIRLDPTNVSGVCVINFTDVAASAFGVGSFAASELRFNTNSAERARIDSSGNLGLGVTPSAWGSGNRAIEMVGGGLSATAASAYAVETFSNCYFDGSNWRYKSTGHANRFANYGTGTPFEGAFKWHTAPSGTAGNAITFTQAMTLDASGNLGVGIASPTFASGNGVQINNTASADARLRLTNAGTGTGNFDGFDLSVTSAGQVNLIGWENQPMTFLTNATERARIDSSGNLLVGKTASSANSGTGFEVRNTGFVSVVGPSSLADTYNYYNSTAGAFRFYVNNAGTIFATSTTISAISDERLKENIQDLDTGLDAVMALKPRRFDWKEGKGQDKKNAAGFIAQEFETVFPDSVGTSKAGEDGIDYKNICHEELIPTLVKAIQEQQALILTLQADVAALKAAA